MRFVDRAGRRPWLSLVPVAIAVLALAALAAIPWSARWRLAKVRLETAETLTPARDLVRDMAAALEFRVAARTPGQLAAVANARDSALRVLAPRLGDTLAADVARLRSLTAQWRANPSLVAPGDSVRLTEVLSAAARLDTALAKRIEQQGVRIRSLEAMDVYLPSVLVPLLVAVLFAIFMTGRRMQALATEAEQSRLALALASEQKVTLVRGLTHDLKNALGAAGGFANLLLEETAGPLTPLQREHVGRIGRIIEQATLAVEDSLKVARAEAGRLPVHPNLEDIRALVLESASDYVAAAERAGLTLTVEVGEDLPSLETDSNLVSKIIGNLLSNAIKYTPAGGRIWLRASPEPAWDGPGTGPWVAIDVSDTGPGIPISLHEKIFDEFFRAPSATTTARGEGIGLAMSRRVARELGGEITLDSEEGAGAVFTLWLPAPQSAAPNAKSSPPVTSRARAEGHHRARPYDRRPVS